MSVETRISYNKLKIIIQNENVKRKQNVGNIAHQLAQMYGYTRTLNRCKDIIFRIIFSTLKYLYPLYITSTYYICALCG